MRTFLWNNGEVARFCSWKGQLSRFGMGLELLLV